MSEITKGDQCRFTTIDLGGAEGIISSGLKELKLPEGVGLVLPHQTHSVNIGVVTKPDEQFDDTDALITQLNDVAVGVRTADCVPVILYAPDVKAVAAVHAGWKGTIGRIVSKTIGKLVELGANTAEIKALFGPSICGECYEIGVDLAEMFTEAELGDAVMWGVGVDPLGEKLFDERTVRLNLQKANTIIMAESGVQMCNIHPSSECTRHSRRRWPSWRRTYGVADRLVTAIHLTE